MNTRLNMIIKNQLHLDLHLVVSEKILTIDFNTKNTKTAEELLKNHREYSIYII